MTLRTALIQGVKLLEDGRVGVPRLTAEVLLSFAVRRDRSYLYAHPEEELSEIAWIHFGRYLHERLRGKPTQYITHVQEFYGREFRVTPDVLIPRPETEHLVETALGRIEAGWRIADVGCGSGAIAATLALESEARVYATDVSQAALCVAASNAASLGATVSFVCCNLLAAFGGQSLDVVVSNPPYIPNAQAASLPREVRDWEPALALFSGSTGFEVYERLVAESAVILRPGGWLLMELGYNSGEPVRRMLEQNWEMVEVTPDLAGIPRVAAAQLKS